MVYGTDDGVYISDLREVNKDPLKVLALQEVTQIDVLEEFQLLIVLSGESEGIRRNSIGEPLPLKNVR